MTVNLTTTMSVTATGQTASGNNSFAPTIAGSHFILSIQSATTSWVAINLGSIGTLAYLYVKNTDPTNYVQVTADGATGSKILAKLKPGESLLIPVDPSATYGVRANTAACDCHIVACEA